jgi:tetratricopeptide (TPR) repeat protein
LVVAVVVWASAGGVARADAAQDARARERYATGKAAYTAANYQRAYDDFREAFQLSHQAELLYNIASALQGLKRPHDAAEALASYLRLRPDDPEKPAIEERMRTLKEEQRIIDLEKKAHEPPPPPRVVTPPPPQIIVREVAPPPAPKSSRGRTVGIAVGVTAGVLVLAGAAVGLVFALSPASAQDPTTGSIGVIQATR